MRASLHDRGFFTYALHFEFLPEFKTEDEVNEYIYQQKKDRPLAEVEAVSEEALNAPVKSKSESRSAPLWRYINGELCEHYEEHSSMIRHG